eukprot:scaffold30528_cov61-Cyclotella_meneghiniana.AAC.4
MADRRLQRPQIMQQTTPTVPSFHEPSSLSTTAFLPTGCPESSNSGVMVTVTSPVSCFCQSSPRSRSASRPHCRLTAST